jgi:hypothetical protein
MFEVLIVKCLIQISNFEDNIVYVDSMIHYQIKTPCAFSETFGDVAVG